jgi:TonB family protein
MIPRLLVPKDSRPLSAEPASTEPRRTTTSLDERTIIPAGISSGTLDATSNIPAYRPLDVLAERVVVPRDAVAKGLDVTRYTAGHLAAMTLDTRIAVPEGLPTITLPSKPPVSAYYLPDVLEPDVMTTGEVALMVRPLEDRISGWNAVMRNGAALLIQALMLSFYVLVLPKLFPSHGPTQEQIDLAREQISWANLPALNELPRGPRPAPAPPTPQVHVDPRMLSRLAPMPAPQPNPGLRAPERASPQNQTDSLPAAPTPQPTIEPHQVETPTVAPTPHPTANGLILPRMSSPGHALEDLSHQSSRGDGAPSVGFQGRLPGSGGGGYPGGGGGGGGTYNGGIQMLTPTEGVDFSGYLERVLARVKQNWYAVIPESAIMGERGRVILEFNINRDGSVPDDQPEMVGSSSKQELDRAAISSIRASNPFEPLPPAFSGPFIRLRFIYLYNIPLNEGQ